MTDCLDYLQGLDDSKHLTRERSLNALSRALDEGAWKEDGPRITTRVFELLDSTDWEGRQGGFLAAKVLLPFHDNVDEFAERLLEACEHHLEDVEARVRLAVGELLRVLAEMRGADVYLRLQGRLIHSIESNFEREPEEDLQESGSMSPRSLRSDTSVGLAWNKRTGLRHDTEGWKCLETSFKALQCLIVGTGMKVVAHMGPKERELIYRALQHPNRFVRETGFLTMESLCGILRGSDLLPQLDELSGWLAKGLGDNWSQVRFAASVATRAFFDGMDEDSKTACMPTLLPRMCLNRYYVAEGVRLYSQETWRLVMGDQGRFRVARCAPQVVDYYIEASQADNHAVREAACACIAELMNKVEQEAVSPFVPRLLTALVDCFKDESWPVRDAACAACGKCVGSFPEESKAVIDQLYELWFAHLWDNIWSVRQTSACALGEVLRVYGDDAYNRLLPVLKAYLPKALVQPRDSTKNGQLQNVSTFGVAKNKDSSVPPPPDAPPPPPSQPEPPSDPRDPRFENQAMFSCGSLGPKLKRGGGCMDHGFTREKEPWEASDGALYMLRELASIRPDDIPQFLPQVLELSRMQLASFRHAYNLHETIWKQLPVLAKNMGKKKFKPYLEEFIEPMFQSLRCGNRLAEAAAGYCIGEFRQMLGETIFAGRLNESQMQQMRDSPYCGGNGIPAGPSGGAGKVLADAYAPRDLTWA